MGELGKTVWDAQGANYQNPTAYGNVLAQSSVVAGVATRALVTHIGSGTPVVGSLNISTVYDTSSALQAQASVVAGASARTSNAVNPPNRNSTTLLAQDATVEGRSENTIIGSRTLEVKVSTVAGNAIDKHTGSGTLEAQSLNTLGIGVPLNLATGILLAQASTVSGAAQHGLFSLRTLEAQASTALGTTIDKYTGSGILVAQASVVVGVSKNITTGSGILEA